MPFQYEDETKRWSPEAGGYVDKKTGSLIGSAPVNAAPSPVAPAAPAAPPASGGGGNSLGQQLMSLRDWGGTNNVGVGFNQGTGMVNLTPKYGGNTVSFKQGSPEAAKYGLSLNPAGDTHYLTNGGNALVEQMGIGAKPQPVGLPSNIVDLLANRKPFDQSAQKNYLSQYQEMLSSQNAPLLEQARRETEQRQSTLQKLYAQRRRDLVNQGALAGEGIQNVMALQGLTGEPMARALADVNTSTMDQAGQLAQGQIGDISAALADLESRRLQLGQQANAGALSALMNRTETEADKDYQERWKLADMLMQLRESQQGQANADRAYGLQKDIFGLQKQGQEFSQGMELSKFDYEMGRDAITDERAKVEFDFNVEKFGLEYGLKKAIEEGQLDVSKMNAATSRMNAQTSQGQLGEAIRSNKAGEAIAAAKVAMDNGANEKTAEYIGAMGDYATREEALTEFNKYLKKMELEGVDINLVRSEIDRIFPPPALPILPNSHSGNSQAAPKPTNPSWGAMNTNKLSPIGIPKG